MYSVYKVDYRERTAPKILNIWSYFIDFHIFFYFPDRPRISEIAECLKTSGLSSIDTVNRSDTKYDV